MRDELFHAVLHGDGRCEVGCRVDRRRALAGRFRGAQQQEAEHDDDGGRQNEDDCGAAIGHERGLTSLRLREVGGHGNVAHECRQRLGDKQEEAGALGEVHFRPAFGGHNEEHEQHGEAHAGARGKVRAELGGIFGRNRHDEHAGEEEEHVRDPVKEDDAVE